MSFKVRIAAALAGVSVISMAAAAQPAAAQSAANTRSYNIPAQDLGSALNAFAEASGVDVMFTPDSVRGKRAPALRGDFSRDAALSILLKGSGLNWRVNGSAILIERAVGNGGALAADDGDAESADQVDQEIVVTGSHIRGSAPSGANLFVMRREDLAKSGRASLAEAIQTLPQVHGGGRNDATTRSGAGAAGNLLGISAGYGASSINLRGIGVEETLTLVNGRRLAPAGHFGALADISALPLGVVDRVEILADGASATYGADAMAGVVNIVLNRRFDGAETRLRTGIETRSGEPDFQVDQTFGWASDKGSILLAGNYGRQEGITAQGRPFAASADYRSRGGTDRRSTYCNPGNILAPAAVAGAIPGGQDGRDLTPDQILIGETNRCESYTPNAHLIPAAEKESLYLSGSLNLTDRLKLSTDLLATHRDTRTISSLNEAFIIVPPSNAIRQTNGFGSDARLQDQPIYITYQFADIDPQSYTTKMWSFAASAGAEYDLGNRWDLHLYGAYSRYKSTDDTLLLDTRPASQGGSLETALASSNPTLAFNPFGGPGDNDRTLIESFFVPYHYMQRSEYRSVSIGANGPLVLLPGGTMKLAIGGDHRHETFATRDRTRYPNAPATLQSSSEFQSSRDVTAIYGEMFIPVFSDDNSSALAKELNISVSGRYDHYSDFGGTFNPKIGATWVPFSGIKIRGSYGTSFKAPLFRSLFSPSIAQFFVIPAELGRVDNDGDGLTSLMLVTGGNAQLGPEKGTSFTMGAEIEPSIVPGLRLRATYFNIGFKGRFANANAGLVLADPAAYDGVAYFALPSQAQVNDLVNAIDQVRGVVPPPGTVEAIIDERTLNFLSQRIDGIDTGVDYRWHALSGTFNLSVNASYLSRYKSRLGNDVAVTSYLGNVGLPTRWRARGSVGWANERISIDGSANYVSSYRNKLVANPHRVSSYMTVDLALQAKLAGKLEKVVGTNASVSLYITNIFDKGPPFVDLSGYDGANADPVGRRLALQISKRW